MKSNKEWLLFKLPRANFYDKLLSEIEPKKLVNKNKNVTSKKNKRFGSFSI